jgi:hypothetical protein
LYHLPYGPRVSAAPITGGVIGTLLPLPISGYEVDVARSGSRLLIASARSSLDVDLVISSTTLDFADGGPAEVVATSAGSMESPSVAGDGSGWLVVWEEPLPNGRFQIAGALVDAAGMVGAPFLVASNGTQPSVAYAAGRYLVSFNTIPTQAVAVSTTGAVGQRSFFPSDVEPGKPLSSLTVGSEVWVSYPSNQSFAVARLLPDGGNVAGPSVVTATGYDLDGTQLVTLASGAHQAVWMDSSADRFFTAMVNAQGIAGAPVVFLAGVAGARPLAQVVGDDVVVLAYLGGTGLRLMRLSGTAVIDSQTLAIGRTFVSTLGLSTTQTPEGVYAAMTVEGDNRLELLPLRYVEPPGAPRRSNRPRFQP